MAGLLLAAAACGSGSQTTVVVVKLAAPTDPPGVVVPAQSITVKVSNAGTTIMQMYMNGPISYPATFSVTPHDRTGALDIDAVAVGNESLARTAHGVGSVPIRPLARADLTVTLLPDDYVLNSRHTGLQSPSYGWGLQGRQLGSASDGTLAFIYEDSCPQNSRCDIWGRLFDASGKPRPNQIIGDDSDFLINSSNVGTNTHPTLGVAPSGGFAAAWKTLTMGMPSDLRARVFQSNAMPAGSEFSLLASTMANREPDDPMVGARPDGSFVVVWTQEKFTMAGMPGPLYIHARLLHGDGSTLTDYIVNDPNPPAPNTHANDDHQTPFISIAPDGWSAIVWVRGASGCHDGLSPSNGCEVRVRFYDSGGTPSPTEQSISSQPTGHAITPVVAPVPGGWLIVWNDILATGPDTDGPAIVARLFNRLGQATSSNFVVNTLTAGQQWEPAVATLADGSALIVWTDESMRGQDMLGEAVRGRVLRPFGLPLGDDFPVNTTSPANQYRPSVAATKSKAFFSLFADESNLPPDTDGDVRGRFLLPDFGRKDGVVGALCGSGSPCGNGLLCATARDGQSYCHVACTQVAQDCLTGGKCTGSSGPDGGNICLF